MPYILDPNKIKKSSDELYEELLKIPKDTIAYEKKFREYLTKNFYEQGLATPEFDEEIILPERQVINKDYIPGVKKIKCWEFQPYEKKGKPELDIEGWDKCVVTDAYGRNVVVQGVAHIIFDEDDIGYNYKIEELVSDDDMFLLKIKGEANLELGYIKQTTVKGDIGIYTDLNVAGFKSVKEMLTTTPQQFKSKLEEEEYPPDVIKELMEERKATFTTGKPLKLRKHALAIKQSAPEKLD